VRERPWPSAPGAGPPLYAALLIAALVAAGCGPAPTTQPPAATVVPTTGALTLPPTPLPSAEAASTPPGSPARSPTVELDPGLLMILPPAVDGAAVAAEPDSFASAASDPAFAGNVESAAFAIVADGNDLASGVVAHLRPGAYSDAFFRDWRDTYDQGACEQAGGVATNAQVDLGGRTVHITSCAGGLLVYHVYLPERDVLISMLSLGDRRFGEQLMRDLRP
jgi:hypothetical protein